MNSLFQLICSQLVWLMRCENPRIHCVLYNPLQCYVRVKTIWWLYSSHISAQYSHVRLCCFSPTILKASVSCALKSTVYELCAFQIVLAYIDNKRVMFSKGHRNCSFKIYCPSYCQLPCTSVLLYRICIPYLVGKHVVELCSRLLKIILCVRLSSLIYCSPFINTSIAI